MTDNQNFEWSFIVSSVDGPGDERIDRLDKRADAFVSSHGDLTKVTVTSEGGPTAVEAAHTALRHLRDSGFEVVRTSPDYVSRSDIAERAGVTRQAVTHWFGGKRREENKFPTPVNPVGGGIWLWGDVADWLRANDNDVDEGLCFPTLWDHTVIDYEITVGETKVAGMIPVEIASAGGAHYALVTESWRRVFAVGGRRIVDSMQPFVVSGLFPDVGVAGVADVVADALKNITGQRDEERDELEDLLRD